MAIKNKTQFVKTIFFSIFIFGSLMLISSMWALDFMGVETDPQGYIRSTFSVPTAVGFEMTLEALPTREHESGYNSGGGGGEGEDHDVEPTPSPTFDVADWVAEEDLSDDLADE